MFGPSGYFFIFYPTYSSSYYTGFNGTANDAILRADDFIVQGYIKRIDLMPLSKVAVVSPT